MKIYVSIYGAKHPKIRNRIRKRKSKRRNSLKRTTPMANRLVIRAGSVILNYKSLTKNVYENNKNRTEFDQRYCNK
jgi:hypothetical protein